MYQNEYEKSKQNFPRLTLLYEYEEALKTNMFSAKDLSLLKDTYTRVKVSKDLTILGKLSDALYQFNVADTNIYKMQYASLLMQMVFTLNQIL